MSGRALVVVVLALGLVAPAARAAPAPPEAPPRPLLERPVGGLVGLTLRRFERELELTQGGVTSSDEDGLWTLGVWVGARLAYTDPRAPGGHLRGDLELGLELVPHTGAAPLSMQVTTAWVWRLSRTLWLSVGARLALSADLSADDYDHGELALPVALGWCGVELQLAAGFSFPLGVQEHAVYGGQVRKGAALALMPLSAALVFRVF